MNEPNVNAHGREAGPPNLAPAPQPLPPRPQAPAPMMPGVMNGTPNGAMPGPSSMGARLPSSIPLRPPTAAPAPAPPTTGGNVSPLNAQPFLNAADGTASGQGDDQSTLLKLLATLGHTSGPTGGNDNSYS